MRKNAWFGLVAALLVVGAIVGFLVYKGASSFSFHVEMKDAGKLAAGDRVYFRGVMIGSVTKVDLQGDGVEALVELKTDPPARPHMKDLIVVWEDKLISGKKCLLVIARDPDRGLPLSPGASIKGFGARGKVIFEVGKVKAKQAFEAAMQEGQGLLAKIRKAGSNVTEGISKWLDEQSSPVPE